MLRPGRPCLDLPRGRQPTPRFLCCREMGTWPLTAY